MSSSRSSGSQPLLTLVPSGASADQWWPASACLTQGDAFTFPGDADRREDERVSDASIRLQWAAQELAGAVAGLLSDLRPVTNSHAAASSEQASAQGTRTDPLHSSHQPILAIRMLGQFRVTRAGSEISTAEFRGRRVRQLIQILLTAHPAVLTKDRLLDALWPHSSTCGAANLSVLVSRARRALGNPALIVARGGGYAFRHDASCWVDAEVFEDHVDRGRAAAASGCHVAAVHAFRSAAALWEGEPLAEDAEAGWAMSYRRHFSALHLESLEGLATAALETGQPNVALASAKGALELDALSERALVLLMRALAELGSPAEAIDRFTRWRRWLVTEMGLNPSGRALEMFERLLQEDVTISPPTGRIVPAGATRGSTPAEVGTVSAYERTNLALVEVLGALYEFDRRTARPALPSLPLIPSLHESR